LPDNIHSKPNIQKGITELRNKHFVSNIRGDGEFKWKRESAEDEFTLEDKTLYSSSSPFDNHSRLVDRVIRTIRDAVGQNYYDMRNEKRVQQMVGFYNHTPHNSLKIGKMIFTPEEVERDKELEGVFIRRSKQIKDVVKQKQIEAGLYSYKEGNIIMVHLDLSRTNYKFMKTRRRFNVLAIFKEYFHGNVVCKIWKSGFDREERENVEREEDKSFDRTIKNKLITVPIYFTKFVAENPQNVPKEFLDYFQ
jgi:hypothetical protein